MIVGYVQAKPSFGKVKENVNKALSLASRIRADLIVLPELFNTGYSFKNRSEVNNYAENVVNGYTAKKLMEFTEKKNSFLVAGIAEKEGGNLYNSAILVAHGRVLYTYRKTHLFYKEKEWFDPGDTGFNVIDLDGFKLGIMICFDWIFPEAARTLAVKGAEIIAHPSNLVLPGLGQIGMRVRSIENRVFTITANRVGFERKGGEFFKFTGMSQIVDPGGVILARSGEKKEAAKSVKLNLSLARDKKITCFNDVLKDRRPEYYFR